MKMNTYQTLEFLGHELCFCAGHFTIFSKTKRECLHGHNYFLQASITAAISEPGITFDYGQLRHYLQTLCKSLNSRLLLPAHSPYLTIQSDHSHHHVTFNNKTMSLLKEDVILMPLPNITLETLSQWFLSQLQQDTAFIEQHQIIAVWIKVFNGPNHCALAKWESPKKSSLNITK